MLQPTRALSQLEEHRTQRARNSTRPCTLPVEIARTNTGLARSECTTRGTWQFRSHGGRRVQPMCALCVLCCCVVVLLCFRFRVSVFGFSVFGFRFSFFGFGMLVVGCLLLLRGCWVFVFWVFGLGLRLDKNPGNP